MAHVQYATDVAFDTDLQDVGFDSDGYVISALKKTAGVPATPAGKYRPGAIVQNIASGVVYRNSGSTATPAWTAM